MDVPEVFCYHQCAACDRVAMIDPKLSMPDGWKRVFDPDDDLVELCLDCQKCPTCGFTNDDERSFYCSNAWHLTGEDRTPEPRPYLS